MSDYKYELVLVFDPDMDEQAVSAQIEKIEAVVGAHQGVVEKKDVWGKKQLAYPINKKSYGNYIVIVATGSNALVAELTRQLRINDLVMRFLFVKKDKFAPDFKLPVDDPAEARGRGRPGSGRRRGGDFDDSLDDDDDDRGSSSDRGRRSAAAN